MSRYFARCAFFAILLIHAEPVWAFPPYRSTDADTAPPWVLEARFGVLQLRRRDGRNQYASPLLRTNLGLPRRTELVSEFEYLTDEDRIGDAAVGMKWVPIMGSVNLGLEALALLPVSDQSGTGAEVSLLTTKRADPFRVHVNAAAFYDPRASAVERGWKVGIIGEREKGRCRAGMEIFASRIRGERVQALAGPGIILKTGHVDIRSGVHLGLTRESPDVTVSLWVTSALPVRRS